MMMRGFRAILLSAGILAAWAVPAHAQAIGSIFGKVTDSSGRRAAGRDRHRHWPGAAAAADRRDQRKRDVPVSQRADRHVHRDVRARQLQESAAPERRHHDRLQRRRRSEDGNRQHDRRGHDFRRQPGRRYQEDDDRRGLHRRRPGEDPDGARPVADHQHDPRRAGRPQRRRLVLRPAGRAELARHQPRTCSGTSKADRSPTCRRTRRRRTSTSTRSSRSR